MAGGLPPLDVAAAACGAEVAREPVGLLAGAAEGEPEFVALAAVPVALRLGAGRWERLCVFILGHALRLREALVPVKSIRST